jgi:predicted secreted Zn-dependent protease
MPRHEWQVSVRRAALAIARLEAYSPAAVQFQLRGRNKMRKVLFTAISLLLLEPAAMAQGKVNTKWDCAKQAVEHQLDVGDVAGHTYSIMQGDCKATSSDEGFAEKAGAYTEFRETWKSSYTGHGRFNVTMDNGDKVFYSYEQTGSADIAKPAHNKWRIHSGTGKYKGTKGSGTCTGMFHEDGSSDWTCTGTYSMAK